MQPLPFEPNSKKKRAAKTPPQPVNKPTNKPGKSPQPAPKNIPAPQASTQASKRENLGIPKVVSDRMVKRAALFCGIPTSLGFITLIASYIVVSRHLFELPNTLVLLFSLGLTGIGVLGLSYGALSASWDENRLGTWWGGAEFQRNFSYLAAAWRNQKTNPPTDPQ